ncbi:MAG: translocation/assembly module TamB domain-containing protein, partial [Alloprevotella sp.]|nr:translocation/assembly module TamB domain-containing protein [Alloprevotella sp.]
SIQDIIRKDFTLQRGGRITFSGEPYQGDLDLQAIYTVNSASLSDLGLGTGFSQNSVRVNCLLGFSGKVENPQVSFDLDLPTVNEEEKRLVRNLISTEEDMTTQVLYLLGIGRFYSYNATQATSAGASAAGAQSAAAMKSFLAGTLSSQLNDIIQNAVGSNNWTFGANVSTGTAGTNDMEVEGLLSGRLFNNRLLVNGNIGYRDNSIYSNNFIGDFDVQYLLTPGGSVRLKAYSETNDRYFTKSALTTQGVGIQLSRDFSSLKDLFTIKKKKKKTKKTKE